MLDLKTNSVNHLMQQTSYCDLDADVKSDIRMIMRVAFDVKHFNSNVLSANGHSGTSIFRIKNKINNMCEIAVESLEQLKQTNCTMYNKVVGDLKYL